jgi:hypothetical protein
VKLPVRLIAVDIDGTLLNSRFQVSNENRAALRRAHDAGIEVVLTTGRRHAFALPIAQELGFDLWLISSNGAITKSLHGELFYRDLLPASVARRVVTHMAAFSQHAVLTFDLETRGALVIEPGAEHNPSLSRWMEKNAEFIQKVSSLEQAITTDPVQVMFCGVIPRMNEAEACLGSGDFAGDITVLKTQYEHRNMCIMDVLNGNCSKGHALKRWLAHRGIRCSEVMAIGDNYNDVEMLEIAGIPVIMENACEELKQNGWRITLTNDQSGVAAALEAVGI